MRAWIAARSGVVLEVEVAATDVECVVVAVRRGTNDGLILRLFESHCDILIEAVGPAVNGVI